MFSRFLSSGITTEAFGRRIHSLGAGTHLPPTTEEGRRRKKSKLSCAVLIVVVVPAARASPPSFTSYSFVSRECLSSFVSISWWCLPTLPVFSLSLSLFTGATVKDRHSLTSLLLLEPAAARVLTLAVPDYYRLPLAYYSFTFVHCRLFPSTHSLSLSYCFQLR